MPVPFLPALPYLPLPVLSPSDLDTDNLFSLQLTGIFLNTEGMSISLSSKGV